MSATKENVLGWTPERVETAAARWRAEHAVFLLSR